MTILCGTETSLLGASAADVAAEIAQRSEQSLALVHVVGFPASQRNEPQNRERLERAEGRLQAEAMRLRQRCARVTTQVLFGDVAEALIEHAYEVKAQLLVVGAHDQESWNPWRLGGRADALAAKAALPLLVVRGDASFRAWTHEQRALRIVIGADDSATTDAAVSFVATLQALGPCEVSAVHLFWPPATFDRIGLSGVRSFLELDPVVQKTLTDELAQRLGGIPVKIQPHLGNIGERLATIAAEGGADLVVVGSHGRTGAARLWHGSISHDVLHESRVSVATVPLSSAVQQPRTFQRGLVATDFSERGNAAIALACAAVSRDGILHIVHVVPRRAASWDGATDIFGSEDGAEPVWREAAEKLAKLAEQQTKLSRCRIQVHVLESPRPDKAIVQAAERLHVDFICLSTSAHPAVAQLVVGSVTSKVVAESRRPVLLAQGPRD